jgi:DNA-binding NarL/FixJ family response regulator
LTRLLGEQPDIEVVGEASDGHAAIELARRLSPDVVLMDVSMPHTNGVDAAERIVADNPTVRVIGLSMHEDAEMADAMRAAGATAYLTKNGSPTRIIAAIRGRTTTSARRASDITPQDPADRRRRKTDVVQPSNPAATRAIPRRAVAKRRSAPASKARKRS